MDNKDFWRVYHEHLEMVAGIAGKASYAHEYNPPAVGWWDPHYGGLKCLMYK